MIYQKQNFVDGNILYAQNLNQIENELVRKSSVFVQLEEPTDVIEGDLWFEIDGSGKPSLDDDESTGGNPDGDIVIGNTVLSDWAENDSESLSYIKNRTHWVSDSGTVFPLSEKFIPKSIARVSDIQKYSGTYVQNDEPIDAIEGSLWIDTDESVFSNIAKATNLNNKTKLAVMQNLTEAPTAEDFNALLDLLRAANLIAIE